MTEIEIPSLPWPPSLPELKRLDDLLRCGICYEFVNTSMVTACSHNYCSLCIRQYLTYKTQCPACFSETTGQQLRNNRLLDEIIGLFPALRDKVARGFQTSKGGTINGYLAKKECSDASNECDDESENTESSSNGNLPIKNPLASSDSRLITNTTKNQSKRVENTLPQSPLKSQNNPFFSPKKSKTPISFLSSKTFSGSSQSPSSQRSGNNLDIPMKSSQSGSFSTPIRNSKIGSFSSQMRSSQSGSFSSPKQSMPLNQSVAGQFSIQRSPNVKGKSTEATSSCPVCGVSVPERNINLHLDACLQRTEKENTQQVKKTLSHRRPNMAKLVYSLLSDKQLRQKLKEAGLNNQGDRQKLIRRHQKYTVLYNSECDLESPRPLSELVRQVDREEKDLKGITQQKTIFGYDRKSAPEVIETEQAEYVKKNNNQFSKLIADVKKRQEEAKKRKEEKKRIENNEDDSSTSSLLNGKDNNLNRKNTKSKKDKDLFVKSSIQSTSISVNEGIKIEDVSAIEIHTLNDEELGNLDLTQPMEDLSDLEELGQTSENTKIKDILIETTPDLEDIDFTQPMEDLSDLEELEQTSENNKGTDKLIKTTPDMFSESSPLESRVRGSLHVLSDSSDDSNDSFSLLQDCDAQEQEEEQIPSPNVDSESNIDSETNETEENVRRSSRKQEVEQIPCPNVDSESEEIDEEVPCSSRKQKVEQIPSPNEDSESDEIDEKVRRSSRRNSIKRPVKSNAQDKLLLDALGPETQRLSDDEDGLIQDLDYNPTQDIDDDDEFCGFANSRRSSRNKRNKPDEDTIMPPPLKMKKVLRKKRK